MTNTLPTTSSYSFLNNGVSPYAQKSLTNVPNALVRVNHTGQELSQQIRYQQNLTPYSPWALQNSFNVQLWNIVNKQTEQIHQLQSQLNIYS